VLEAKPKAGEGSINKHNERRERGERREIMSREKYVRRVGNKILSCFSAPSAFSALKTLDNFNVVVATSNEFNELIEELKSYKFSEPPTVKVIESNQIITIDKVKALK